MEISYRKLNNKRILVTGGAGFIGGTLIRRLLSKTNSQIFNMDNLGYCSDLESINKLIEKNQDFYERYKFINCDLKNYCDLENAFEYIDPDLVINLAAETHVDRSIENPEIFVQTNIIGTFNLLEISLRTYDNLNLLRKKEFRFHQVSTDEVFGSVNDGEYFTESSKINPNSPYAASKASGDHLVNAWYKTYGLPVSLTNCSNNYGPWQFPEKLIPLVILNAVEGKKIPLYGDGKQVRDWLFVEDHIDALILTISESDIGSFYCVGSKSDKSNFEVVNLICEIVDKNYPDKLSSIELIKKVEDRPGHDSRYSIDSNLIKKELGWEPKINIYIGLEKTINWYLDNFDWCKRILSKSGYDGQRIGLNRKN